MRRKIGLLSEEKVKELGEHTDEQWIGLRKEYSRMKKCLFAFFFSTPSVVTVAARCQHRPRPLVDVRRPGGQQLSSTRLLSVACVCSKRKIELE